MRREESDGRVVPDGRRKAVPTARNTRGEKATTASERAGQRDLFLETADSPQGAVPGTETDYALDKRYFVKQGLVSLEHRYREMHRIVAPAQLTLALE